MRAIFSVVIFFAFFYNYESARVLFILPVRSVSHTLWHRPIIDRLAGKHEVTVATPYPGHIKTPNVHLIEFEETSPESMEVLNDIEGMLHMDISNYVIYDEYSLETCELLIPTKGFQELNSYAAGTFDVVIFDILMGPQCFYPFLNKNGKHVPIVATLPYGYGEMSSIWMRDYMHPAISPTNDRPVGDVMGFTERFVNLINHVRLYHLLHTKAFPGVKTIVERLTNGGREYDPVEFYAVEDRMNVLLVNGDPFLNYARPSAPDVVDVGGLHADLERARTTPLPTNLQEFLARHKQGVVIFSLGSNLDASNMVPEKIRAFVKVFSELDLGVLWKCRSNLTEYGLSDNVLVQSWLPISNLLAQANVKVFLTHSGLLSTQEALSNGVPTIGIPVFADQMHNSRMTATKGAGIQLQYVDITEANVRRAINEILTNPRYAETAKRIATLYKDQQVAPVDRAVFWVEYSLKHGVVPELHLATRKLNFWQMYCLDILGFLLLVALVGLGVLIWVCKRILNVLGLFPNATIKHKQA